MTQFKVGDRVRRKSGGKIWDNGPETAIVKGIHKHGCISVIEHPLNGCSGWDGTRDWAMFSDSFHLVPTTPPETIQHEGYNYTRGEPVVPDWVKDGAWIVDKEDGSVVQLFICGNSAGVHGYTETDYGGIDLCDVADVFRPFTNEDWKWGMWAEYNGEKVFVVIPEQRTKHAMISGKDFPTGLKYVPLYNLTPTTAP